MARKTNVRQHTRRTKRGISEVTRHDRKLMSYPQAKHRLTAGGDVDGDGVRNSKDCKPYDPKKQGFIHDAKMKGLQWQEERLEKRREKEQAKLNDVKDELRLKKDISEKKMSIKRQELEAKQSVINETLREKREISRIKEDNRKAKQELSKYTISGKLGRAAVSAGQGLRKAGAISARAIRDADKAIKAAERKNRKTIKRKSVGRNTKRKTKKKESNPFGF